MPDRSRAMLGLAFAGLLLAGGFTVAQTAAPTNALPNSYRTIENWGTLPEGMKYGFGCAIVVDGQDRVYVTSRSTSPCVAVFDRDGKLLETWSNEFTGKVGFNTDQYKDTAHGLYWSKEGDGEYLYWTENVSTNKEGPKFGRRVYKTDMKGKVLSHGKERRRLIEVHFLQRGVSVEIESWQTQPIRQQASE